MFSILKSNGKIAPLLPSMFDARAVKLRFFESIKYTHGHSYTHLYTLLT